MPSATVLERLGAIVLRFAQAPLSMLHYVHHFLATEGLRRSIPSPPRASPPSTSHVDLAGEDLSHRRCRIAPLPPDTTPLLVGKLLQKRGIGGGEVEVYLHVGLMFFYFFLPTRMFCQPKHTSIYHGLYLIWFYKLGIKISQQWNLGIRLNDKKMRNAKWTYSF